MITFIVSILVLVPAIFITAVVSTYILLAPEGFHLSKEISYGIGGIATILSGIMFMFYSQKQKTIDAPETESE